MSVFQNKFLKKNKTKVNFLSIVFGNFFYYGIQYLALILFTKNYSQEEVGLYIFALAFIKPIFIPLNLQLRSLFVTETDSNLKVQDYHSLRILGNIVTIISIVVIALVSSPDKLPILLLIALIKIIESQSEMCHAIFQKQQEMVFIGLSKLINGTLIIVSIYVGIILEAEFQYLILIWAIASLSILVFLDIPMSRKKDNDFLNFKKYFKLNKMKKIFWFAWPLFFLEIVSKYYESYPSLSVEKYFGLETLAIFGSIIYFKAIGGQILTQIINIVEPKLANLFKGEQYKEFHRLVLKLVVLGALVGIVIIFILDLTGSFILRNIFTAEYAKHSKLLVLIAISSAISYLYSFLSTALTCMRKHYIKLPISIIGLLLLICLTYFNKEDLTIYNFVYYLIYSEITFAVLYYIAYFFYLKNKMRAPYGV